MRPIWVRVSLFATAQQYNVSVAIQTFARYPELVPLIVNLFMVGAAAAKGEWAKMVYWMGTVILTLGLLFMKG